MNVKNWLRNADALQRQQLADEAKTSVGYLWQLAGDHRKPGVEKAKALVSASELITPDMPLSLADLRPDIWGRSVA